MDTPYTLVPVVVLAHWDVLHDEATRAAESGLPNLWQHLLRERRRTHFVDRSDCRMQFKPQKSRGVACAWRSSDHTRMMNSSYSHGDFK